MGRWLACLFFLSAWGALAAPAPTFTWKLALVKVGSGPSESLPLGRPVALADGQEFQVFVESSAPAWVCALYEGADGTVSSLYLGPVTAGTGLYLPGNGQSFRLTPPRGTEKLTLVVTAEVQPRLEALVKALGVPAGSRTKAGRLVLDEVARIRQSLSSLAEPPERPAPMGGATRGGVELQATEYQGKNAYVKTIRIEH